MCASKKSVIFLDIDGVLNDASTKEMIKGFIGVSDGKLKILKQIVEENDAEIVLTSSWKDDWVRWEERPSDAHTVYGQYLDDRFAEYGLRISDKTEDNWADRGHGIVKYVTQHSVDHFVVLDDEIFRDYRECGIMRHLVQTSWKTGLREKHIKKIRDVLAKSFRDESKKSKR